jgi:4-hydroxy-tetrahydrodipicolinate reductase
MQIALIGYGKMGRLIEKIAEEKGHTICAKINPRQWHPEAINAADICIDFSHPECAFNNIQRIAEKKKNIVMGTTGWTEHLEDVKTLVDKADIGFLHAPNFSIGVVLFLQIIEKAAELISPFEEYECSGWECHHAQKADSPSGTAHAILERLNDKLKKKPPISSIRSGSFPGTHTLYFDSPADTITLSHQARNRNGFAHGALTAAEWLKDKSGFFTLEDMLRL